MLPFPKAASDYHLKAETRGQDYTDSGGITTGDGQADGSEQEWAVTVAIADHRPLFLHGMVARTVTAYLKPFLCDWNIDRY